VALYTLLDGPLSSYSVLRRRWAMTVAPLGAAHPPLLFAFPIRSPERLSAAVWEDPVADIPATITSISTLVAAVGAVTIAYRSSRAASKAADAAEAARATAEEKGAATVAAAAAAQTAAEASKREITVVAGKVVEVGKRIDGRLSELLALTEANALAEGRLQGREAERAGEVEQSQLATKTNGDPPADVP
jgi:hypothetical protein